MKPNSGSGSESDLIAQGKMVIASSAPKLLLESA